MFDRVRLAFMSLHDLVRHDAKIMRRDMGTDATYKPADSELEYPVVVIPSRERRRQMPEAAASQAMAGKAGPVLHGYTNRIQISRRASTESDSAIGPHVGDAGGVTQVNKGDRFLVPASAFGQPEGGTITFLVKQHISTDPRSGFWMLEATS